MRCQLTPLLPRSQRRPQRSVRSCFSSQSSGHATDTITPADHTLQRLRMAMLDEVVESRHDAVAPK
jgi:hypothetical protein